MIPLTHIEVISDLVDGDGVFFEFEVGVGGVRERSHLDVFGIALVEFVGLHEAQDDEAVAGEHPDVAVMVEEDAAFSPHPNPHPIGWGEGEAAVLGAVHL
jgi:hypothetical protein